MSDMKPVSLFYPVAFFGGVLFLCLWILNGNRLFAPVLYVSHQITDSEDVE